MQMRTRRSPRIKGGACQSVQNGRTGLGGCRKHPGAAAKEAGLKPGEETFVGLLNAVEKSIKIYHQMEKLVGYLCTQQEI